MLQGIKLKLKKKLKENKVFKDLMEMHEKCKKNNYCDLNKKKRCIEILEEDVMFLIKKWGIDIYLHKYYKNDDEREKAEAGALIGWFKYFYSLSEKQLLSFGEKYIKELEMKGELPK